MGRDGEAQPHAHTARIAFDRGVNGIPDVREGDDFIKSTICLAF